MTDRCLRIKQRDNGDSGWAGGSGVQGEAMPAAVRRLAKAGVVGYDLRKVVRMASLDWSRCPTVESVPGKRSGAWVFRDTRTPVSVVFDNLEAGASIEEIMDWFHLSREQVSSVVEFAARSLDTPAGTVAA